MSTTKIKTEPGNDYEVIFSTKLEVEFPTIKKECFEFVEVEGPQNSNQTHTSTGDFKSETGNSAEDGKEAIVYTEMQVDNLNIKEEYNENTQFAGKFI